MKAKPSSIYVAWQGMLNRCRNPKHVGFANYGGRGITVCLEWKSFAQFERDMGPKPTPKHTLDRRNNDLGYFPENCRWATQTEQMRNQSVTRWVTIDGKKYLAIELAEQAGVKTDTIVDRVNRGLPYEKVVSKERLPPPPIPPDLWKLSVASRAKKLHCPQGHLYEGKTSQGWRRCKICHRDKERIRQRLRRG